ncbi:MAG: T9SS type A sorting domain-containing protein [bacterium]|nr:T9SS type A sorting domain-containing protein [bacterium]
MKTITLKILLTMTILATITSFAMADIPEPQTGQFGPEVLEWAKLQSMTDPLPEGFKWEDTEAMELDRQQFEADLTRGDRSTINNDSAHYNRGSTLIIHVFISHDGGTWDSTEMDEAGAKAAVAKQYYLDNAPGQANVSFDHEGTDLYWYYHVTLPYTIGYSGTNSSVVDDALAALGFVDSDSDGTRVDEFTFNMQNWNGGWDNVIAEFESDVNGRAWASYGTATTYLYKNSNANVHAHEWGHSFGACDEYVEDSHCNGSIDCGNCQSTYLDDMIINGNCQLATCPMDVSCLMINNTFDNICWYTLNHWGWFDEDSNGQLDNVKWHKSADDTYVDIWELWHNGWFGWNDTTTGKTIHQSANSWAVVGLRSPDTADYDLRMFTDNNHSNQVASSTWGNPSLDFIVGDFNHNRTGNEHIEVSKWSGDTAGYNLTWESGTEMLYPDGISRSHSWADYNNVRVWDVPLFAGETITFSLFNVSGGINPDMALFKSDGSTYWAGRSGSQMSATSGGVNGSESFTYTVPADDVYGLVVWENEGVAGSFDIRIGPVPYTLVEESPYTSAYDLRLYTYIPNAYYWSFVGTRPWTDTGVALSLYDDANFTTHLDTSSSYGNDAIEFFAVDYFQAPFTQEYLRVARDSGTGFHTTEWENDGDIITGTMSSFNWTENHVGKIWDVRLQAGQQYFFREYHDFASDLDTGIYLFDSGSGDNFHGRGDFAQAANYRPATDGGEWFYYTPGTIGWYGFVAIMNNQANGSTAIWNGPAVNMVEDIVETRSEELIWGDMTITASYWSVFGVRGTGADEVSISLYGDNACTINELKASQQWADDVAYVVGDFLHSPNGDYYPRIWRNSGTGAMDFEWEGGSEELSYDVGMSHHYDLNWPVGDVVEIFDLYLEDGESAFIQVKDLSGNLDFGMSLFDSEGGEYFAAPMSAVLSADVNGVGGKESFIFTADHNDWYGLVLYSKNDNGGDYRLTISDEALVAVGDFPTPPTFSLGTTSANPFTRSVSLMYSLPTAAAAELVIYDVRGRKVRSLINSQIDAGSGVVNWDGRNDGGTNMPAGVYLARLSSGGNSLSTKLVRVE